MPRQNTIQLRKGTLSQWTSNNTQILASGEPGFEVDTLRLKIGDGTTAWSGLNYIGLAGTGTSGYLPKFNSSQGVSNSLIFDNGTNIGIGTTTPSRNLHVIGTGLFDSLNIGGTPIGGTSIPFFTRSTTNSASDYLLFIENSSYNPILDVRGDGNVAIGNVGGAGFSHRLVVKGSTSNSSVAALSVINSENTSILFARNDGNVGIGTASPLSRLHITSTGNNDTILEYTNSTAGFNSGVVPLKLSLTAANGAAVGAGVGLDLVTRSNSIEYIGGRIQTNRTDTSNNHALTFWAGGGTTPLTEYMRIGSNGNVGIGTTSPSYKLDVAGDAEFGANNWLKFIDTAGNNGRLVFSNIGSIDAGGDFLFRNNAGTTEHIRVTTGGRVGIGTSSPSSRLSIGGSIDATSVGSTGLSIQTLHFSNTTNGLTNTALAVNPTFSTVNSNVSNTYGLLISPSHSGTYTTTNHYSLYVNASTLITGVLNNNYAAIFMGGNVGIGTAAPSARLEVAASGTTNLDVAHFSNSNGVEKAKISLSSDGDGIFSIIDANNNTDIFFTSNSSTSSYINAGNVGIGTTTPGYKLQVNGSFAASTKSFRIHHPSKKGHSLEYGSLESPYHGVRLTGRGQVIKGVGVISLPSYLKDLIHDDTTLNIQITNIKHGKTIYLEEIDLKNDQFIVKADRAKSLGELEFFWTLTGVRKDVDHLVVEKEN